VPRLAASSASWGAGSDGRAPIQGVEAVVVPGNGTQRTRLTRAARGHRRVTGTEVGDEESLYEVEVTLSDGTQVDVQLDDSFKVVSTSADHEDSGAGDD